MRMSFKKLVMGSVAAAVLATSGVATAGEIEANVALSTDYIFRGISQTDNDPAISGGFDYSFDSGFYAGVWAHHNKKYLQAGDIDEAMSAANAVGDDAIQRRTRGSVNSDSFTHGTSVQRKEWFMKGYNTGDVRNGDTFSAILN